MIEPGIKIEGLKELNDMLKDLPARVEKRVLQKSVLDSLKDAFPSMQRAAPKHKTGQQSPASRKYGSILANLKVLKKRNPRKGQRGAVITTGDAFWSTFFEFGTRSQPARPWFRPAFAALQQSILASLKDRLGKGIEREAQKKQ